MIDISNLTNRRETILVNPAIFARRHFHQRVTAFEVVQGCLLTGTPRNLSTATGAQFDVVNIRSERNRAKRKGISEIRRDIVPGDNFRPDSQSVRRENITQLAVAVLNKSNSRRTVRIVLNRENIRGHAVFAPSEIDLPVILFVAAADVTRSQSAKIISTARFLFRLDQTPCRP